MDSRELSDVVAVIHLRGLTTLEQPPEEFVAEPHSRSTDELLSNPDSSTIDQANELFDNADRAGGEVRRG